MGATYANGQVPSSALVVFNSGTTRHVIGGEVVIEQWQWMTTPGTYAKHLALVALAKRNTGKTLQPSAGFSFYRPLDAQDLARRLFGNGAAIRGTSSHGGYWERRDTMAIDYHNWSTVYGGDRAAWYRDVRAVGLEPGLISRERGYPDEPWHVIDFAPYRAVPAGIGATPFEPPVNLEDEMITISGAGRPWAVIGGVPFGAQKIDNPADQKWAGDISSKVLSGLTTEKYDAYVRIATGGLHIDQVPTVGTEVWGHNVTGVVGGLNAAAMLAQIHATVLGIKDAEGVVDVGGLADRLKAALGGVVADELAKRLTS